MTANSLNFSSWSCQQLKLEFEENLTATCPSKLKKKGGTDLRRAITGFNSLNFSTTTTNKNKLKQQETFFTTSERGPLQNAFPPPIQIWTRP